jgi:hypothetical protein
MKRRKKCRFVYMIARPPRSAGPWDLLFNGKSPLLHWALLVTDSRPELETHSTNSLIETQNILCCRLQGTRFELDPSPDGFRLNIIKEFKLENWCHEGSNVIVGYAGKTRSSDLNLSNTGKISSGRRS